MKIYLEICTAISYTWPVFLLHCLSSLCHHVPWLRCTRFPNHTYDLIWIAGGSTPRATHLIRAAEIFKSLVDKLYSCAVYLVASRVA